MCDIVGIQAATILLVIFQQNFLEEKYRDCPIEVTFFCSLDNIIIFFLVIALILNLCSLLISLKLHTASVSNTKFSSAAGKADRHEHK